MKKETKAEHDTSERLHAMQAKFEQEQAFLEAKLDEIKV